MIVIITQDLFLRLQSQMTVSVAVWMIDQDTNFTLNPLVIPMTSHNYQKQIQKFLDSATLLNKEKEKQQDDNSTKAGQSIFGYDQLKANMDNTISSSDMRQIILRMLMLLLTSHQTRRQKSK